MPLVKSQLVYCNPGPLFPTATVVATLTKHTKRQKTVVCELVLVIARSSN